MYFTEAFKILMSGGKIRRKNWNKLTYIMIKKDKIVSFDGNIPTDIVYFNGDDWEVVGLVSFSDAVRHIMNGGMARRDAWGKDWFLHLDRSGYLTIRNAKMNELSKTHAMHEDNLKADDWILL